MRARVLLNLLNFLTSWEKEIKCEACRAFYFFFASRLIIFNNTRARILDLKLLKNRIFWRENVKNLSPFTFVLWT